MEAIKMTVPEIRDVINSVANSAQEVAAATGTDLRRDSEGFITDTSDLGIAVRELERVAMVLSRLSYRLAE
jgi:hypothetical protein